MIAALMSGTMALSGCGVTYISPSVQNQTEGLNVRVIPATPESVLVANRQPYAPRSLPAIFRQGAGSAGSGVGLGALPDAPTIPDLQPPGTLELRVPPEVVRGPYTIGVGDVIRLATRTQVETITNFEGAPTTQDLRQEYQVRDDGAVAIPEIGSIPVEGVTIETAEERIFQRMIESGLNPTFSVEVAEFNSQRVSIGGAVGSTEVLALDLNPLSLNEAITRAGGIRIDDPEFASIRIYRDGTLYQIPLETYFQRDDLQRLGLAAGDSVYVDSEYDLDRALSYYQSQINVIALRRTSQSQALADLQVEINLRRGALDEERRNFITRTELGAEERDYVYLAGEVNRQSRWPLPYNQQATLADVLFENGGFATETGNPGQIYVLRASPDPADFGAVTAWHLDATNAAAFTLATRMEMRPDDIIFIEEQPITSWSRALDQLFPTIINVAASSI
jgi:polysaccharide biosynthesis/export protein